MEAGREIRRKEMGRREIDVYLDVYMDGEGNRERREGNRKDDRRHRKREVRIDERGRGEKDTKKERKKGE